MMCAVAVRRIKPDSYDEFRKAWQHDPWLPRYRRRSSCAGMARRTRS